MLRQNGVQGPHIHIQYAVIMNCEVLIEMVLYHHWNENFLVTPGNINA